MLVQYLAVNNLHRCHSATSRKVKWSTSQRAQCYIERQHDFSLAFFLVICRKYKTKLNVNYKEEQVAQFVRLYYGYEDLKSSFRKLAN